MASFNQIGPWITAGILFSIVIFFCVFYVVKLLQVRRTSIPNMTDSKLSDDITDTKKSISKEQKKKLKDEIVHDIVADITPVLEKRLEKAF